MSEQAVPRKVERVQSGSWVYDKDLGCLVPKYGRNYFERDEKRSDLPSPSVIGGTMPAIKSMADGRIYETKRNYEKSVSRAGCEIVGFDKRWQEHIKAPQPYGGEKAHEAELVADVKKAIEIEQSKVPSYGPESRRLMRKQRRRERQST
jgi:hypothetical protein